MSRYCPLCGKPCSQFGCICGWAAQQEHPSIYSDERGDWSAANAGYERRIREWVSQGLHLQSHHVAYVLGMVDSLRAEVAALRENNLNVKELFDGKCIGIAQAWAREAVLTTALESIANNSCCAPCREAKLVAQKALDEARALPARLTDSELGKEMGSAKESLLVPPSASGPSKP